MKAMVWPLIDETSNMFLQYSALVVVWWLSSKTLKAEKVFKFRYTPPALHQTLHNLTHTNSKTFFKKKQRQKKTLQYIKKTDYPRQFDHIWKQNKTGSLCPSEG